MSWGQILKGILYMPFAFIRVEPYVFALNRLDFTPLQALIFTLIGTSLSILFWYCLIIVLPRRITAKKSKQDNRIDVWRQKSQRKNKERAEKIHAWLKKHKILFLLPLVIILMDAFPLPVPLPTPIIALFLVKITNYLPQGLFLILAANLLKIYLTLTLIYKIF